MQKLIDIAAREREEKISRDIALASQRLGRHGCDGSPPVAMHDTQQMQPFTDWSYQNATFQLSLRAADHIFVDGQARERMHALVLCGIDKRFVCQAAISHRAFPTEAVQRAWLRSFSLSFYSLSFCCYFKQIDCDESLSNINIGYTRQTARR